MPPKPKPLPAPPVPPRAGGGPDPATKDATKDAAEEIPIGPAYGGPFDATVDDATYERDRAVLAAVRRMHEANPMLGLGGVRLGLEPRGPGRARAWRRAGERGRASRRVTPCST